MARVDVTLTGGPLDGMVIPVDPGDPDPGVAMINDHSSYGPGGRSWYRPDPEGVWRYVGDSA